MRRGIPFRSRFALEWQLVLVDPQLLRRAERLLRATGPSDAIDRALQLVASRAEPIRRDGVRRVPAQ